MEKKFREFQNEHLLLCFKLCTDNCVLQGDHPTAHVVYLTKPKLYANCVTHNVIFKINYFTAVVL